mgnify:CR=1 FL=1
MARPMAPACSRAAATFSAAASIPVTAAPSRASGSHSSPPPHAVHEQRHRVQRLQSDDRHRSRLEAELAEARRQLDRLTITLAAIAGLILAGRFVLRPLFALIGGLGEREMFVVAALFTVVAAAVVVVVQQPPLRILRQ